MTTEIKSENKPGAANESASGKARLLASPLVWTAVFLALSLSVLFYKSFDPNYVLFSNDGPIGIISAAQSKMPEQFFGSWTDLNWFGSEGISPGPNLTNILCTVIGPRLFSRCFAPLTLMFVGLCACFCLQKFKLSPLACILGGLAAGLGSDFFSTSCWGVASQSIGFGGMFLAVGLMYEEGTTWRHWGMTVAAGMGVGLGIMEAFDIGAIFSLFVAAFVMYRAVFVGKGNIAGRIALGAARVALIAGFSAIVSAHVLVGLVNTQVKNVVAAQQDKDIKEKTKPFATQWSLPKKEVLQTFIPGIFGYRNTWHMYDDDQPKADQYWGTIGVDPNVDLAKRGLSSSNPAEREQAENYLKNPGILWRLVGTGFYQGIPVVMLALWAVFQSFRKKNSPFSDRQRIVIRFWLIAAVISLLMSFGRYAPFYDFFYALPYASTIRNPDKFMHVLSWSMIILFAYGVHGLSVAFMRNPVSRSSGLIAQYKSWKARASKFDLRWVTGCFIAIGVAVLGWLLYASSVSKLKEYIQSVAIPAADAESVANFSVQAVGWFVLLLILTTVLMMLIYIGRFSGSKAKLGGILLGALLVFDLGRAGSYWVVYWDMTLKYAADPIIKLLADHSYEHRVAMFPATPNTQQLALMQNAYGSQWKQHLFPYYNVQCIDVVQEPRVAADKEAFLRGFAITDVDSLVRFWQMSNTRYILAPGVGTRFFDQFDPEGKRFKIVQAFELVPKNDHPMSASDFSAQPKADGELAVLELLGALPRASLYSNWQINTNETDTLHQLSSKDFNFHQTVLVDDDSIPKANPANAGQTAGTVTINPNYQPKRIELDAEARVPSILMIADRYNPRWSVEVDGKPAKVLRCNFIERGVFLEPGKHTVVFRFVGSTKILYTSVSAMAFGFLLILGAVLTKRKPASAEAAD